jgi:hypothetical protein
MSSAAHGSFAAGEPAPPDLCALEALARQAAEEPFSVPPHRPVVPAEIQKMWWGWVHGHAVQLPHERLYLFARLDGVRPEDAAAAMRAIVARHHALRTRFAERDGVLNARLNAAEDFQVETVRLDGADDLEAAFEAARAAFSRPELRIEGPWLVRGRVVVGDGRLMVCFVFHHQVFDARSRMLVEQELRQRLEPGTDPGGDLGAPGQYLDYAAWEQDWLATSGAALVRYWRAWLGTVPPLANPGGGALVWRPSHKVYYDLELSGEPIDRLRTMAGAATSFRLLLVATGLAVSRWAGQRRFAIRTVGDLRTTRPLDDMVGNLVCTDLVAMDMAEGATLQALVDQARTGHKAATGLRCQNLLGLPDSPAFPDVSEVSIGTRTAVTLNYMPNYRLRGGAPPIPGAPGAYGPATVTRDTQREFWPTPVCPINLRIWDWGSRLVCRMEFDDDAISEADQRGFIDHLARAIRGLPDMA